ncbi:MAG: flagellar assembly protein FliW [Ignavibacteriaceae bacterium]|nr:flagellar assembly protein FliW [Ignavibacteriaceae bacterium]
MKIVTEQFGEIEFREENVFQFSSGVLGFEQLKKFLLIKTDEELFYWLNSTEEPEIVFPLVGLGVIEEDYPTAEKYEAFGIVTLNSDPLKITVNMKAPVYLNQDEKKGFQKIIDSEKYNVYYNLFVE